MYDEASGKNYKVQDVPEESKAEVKEAKDKLIEHLAEADDEVMQYFVEAKPCPKEIIKKAIRRQVVRNAFVPVFCGSSFKNKGIQPILDAVCAYLPSPADKEIIKGTDPNTDQYEERQVSDEASFCGLCFKVASDPYVGRLNFVRVYSGVVKSGTYIYNATKRGKGKGDQDSPYACQ